MIKVGLLGLGTVGSGVYEILSSRRDSLIRTLGEDIEVTKILVKDIHKKRELDVPKNLLTTDGFEIVNDPDIDIVVEAIGGILDSYSFISSDLKNKKHIVTANKAVVEKYMKDLLYFSELSNKAFLFEGSVGGGIPIIKPLKQYALVNEIKEIKGILNGTTNFILTKMFEESLSFNAALQLARDLGYAEADPTDDIEGYDVARKLAILCSVAFNNEIKYENIACMGISSIEAEDIEFLKAMGWCVKLVGKVLNHNDQLYACAEPLIIDENSSFAKVKDAFNIVSITGSFGGELQFYGMGAGKNPTANAVVSDIIDVITGTYKSDGFNFSKLQGTSVPSSILGSYYLRLKEKGIKNREKAVYILREADLVQRIITKEESLIIITKETCRENLENIIKLIKKYVESCTYIKLEENIANAS